MNGERIKEVAFWFLVVASCIFVWGFASRTGELNITKQELSEAREIIRETRRINEKVNQRLQRAISSTTNAETRVRRSIEGLGEIEVRNSNINGTISELDRTNKLIRAEIEQYRECIR